MCRKAMCEATKSYASLIKKTKTDPRASIGAFESKRSSIVDVKEVNEVERQQNYSL